MRELIEDTIFTFQTVEMGHGYMVIHFTITPLYVSNLPHLNVKERENVRALYEKYL